MSQGILMIVMSNKMMNSHGKDGPTESTGKLKILRFKNKAVADNGRINA